MNRKGVIPRKPPTPTPQEIAERSAVIREQWTEEQRLRRLAEPSPPIILWPMDGTTIGLSMADEQSPI